MHTFIQSLSLYIAMWHLTIIIIISDRVESGLDDPDNLGHLGCFLVGQVGLIHKLNYLDVTQISHVL